MEQVAHTEKRFLYIRGTGQRCTCAFLILNHFQKSLSRSLLLQNMDFLFLRVLTNNVYDDSDAVVPLKTLQEGSGV